jgi:hypothetical protein
MRETKMGYRGSKSAISLPGGPFRAGRGKNIAVKEQRVDGSWCINPKIMHLRCTLMDFERSYQVRFLSNQLNKNYFSTVSVKPAPLNHYFVTGFCDAESSFQVLVTKNKNSSLGWSVRALFTMGLHSQDLALLLQIKDFFLCGVVVKNDTRNEISFRVNSLQDITNIIIPHFSNYPLLTQKSADFKLFKQVTELMQNKAHLTTEGLQEIINIKSSMNLGLSDELKFNFINTVPVQRPTIITTNIPDFN